MGALMLLISIIIKWVLKIMRPSEKKQAEEIDKAMQEIDHGKQLIAYGVSTEHRVVAKRILTEAEKKHLKNVIRSAMIQSIRVEARCIALAELAEEVQAEIEAEIKAGKTPVLPPIERDWQTFAEDLKYDAEKLLSSGCLLLDELFKNKTRLAFIGGAMGSLAFGAYQAGLYFTPSLSSVAYVASSAVTSVASVASSPLTVAGGAVICVGVVANEARKKFCNKV